jgi:hypothetical protein
VLNTETDRAPTVSNGTALHSLNGVTGVQVIDFTNTVKGPVSPYYLKWLTDNGFPGSITPAQLEPRLAALGVDVPSLLATLMPRLTTAQQALVTEVLTSPVPLDYSYFYSGVVAVEPHTGALIWVDTTAEGLKVAPSLAGVNRLRPLLTEYSGLPGVNTLSNALNTLAAAPPQMVIDFNYVQTRASAQSMADYAHSQIGRMNLVNALPWIAGGIGVVLVGLGLLARRRHSGEALPSGVVALPRLRNSARPGGLRLPKLGLRGSKTTEEGGPP